MYRSSSSQSGAGQSTHEAPLWREARASLEGLPNGGLNIAHEAVVRHARGARAEREAIRFIGREGRSMALTYRELDAASNRFANILARLEVQPGERVFCLTGRTPSLYIAALGALKHRSVFAPLFSAFGPAPVAERMMLGEASILVTTSGFYARKVAPIRAKIPSLRHVLIVDGDELAEHTLSLENLMGGASTSYQIGATDPEDLALLHFTSGTTGRPKAAMHVHDAVVGHLATAQLALDLQEGDRYFCTADPGWVTGTSYGIIAPLVTGATLIVDEEEFEPVRWYRILSEQRVNVWYTAPTAIRMLMRAGTDLAKPYDLSALRFAASVGEPLNAEAVMWGMNEIGVTFHDNWWQTETGCILIANYGDYPIRPGSMGRPLPGVEVALVRRQKDGLELIDKADAEGELAIGTPWPSMFRGYLGERERYQACFSDSWYLTGDLARRDRRGNLWFVGRSDDVIKSAGHLIGPFEVESVLIEHPAIYEAAVVGVPDPVAMEIVKAFVSLHEGVQPTDALRLSILAHARRRLGPAAAPREIEFRQSLPKTQSGKIMRRVLRDEEAEAASHGESKAAPP